MASRRFLLEADEALIVIEEHSDKTGKCLERHVRDTGKIGEFGNFDWIQHWLTDKTVCVMCLNISKVNASGKHEAEDLTEECARQWLIADDADDANPVVYPDDEGSYDHCEERMPLYVKRSKAWARWIDDVEAETPVNMAREWGTYSTTNGHAA